MTDRELIFTENHQHESDQARPKLCTDAVIVILSSAASSSTDERRRVLKHGDTFAVFDQFGDIKPGGLGEGGNLPSRHPLPLLPAAGTRVGPAVSSSAQLSGTRTTS